MNCQLVDAQGRQQRQKKCAILRSNYIPWKGYFDIIGMVDQFILFDDLQFTKQDWRNRNLIKTREGLHWLTIPVKVKGKCHQKVKETEIVDLCWGKKHWVTIASNYSKARYFKDYRDFFEDLYMKRATSKFLSEINYEFLKAISSLLEIHTSIVWSMDYHLVDGKTERLIDLCHQVGASVYLTGPVARSYLDKELFWNGGIQLEFMDYSGYPEYNQLFSPFEHKVSIIDLIFNQGPNSRKFMKA